MTVLTYTASCEELEPNARLSEKVHNNDKTFVVHTYVSCGHDTKCENNNKTWFVEFMQFIQIIM